MLPIGSLCRRLFAVHCLENCQQMLLGAWVLCKKGSCRFAACTAVKSSHCDYNYAVPRLSRLMTEIEEFTEDEVSKCVFVFRDARNICLREYGSAPEVITFSSPGLRFPYIPSHLHHMIFELTKNSLRAVADRFEDSLESEPPIRVVVSQGDEDITIKVRKARYLCMYDP
jgi:hypothetical protein